METALEIFSHPLFGSALGAMGIILGFYFYFSSRRFARFSLQMQEVSIIGMHRSAPANGLEIRYKGKTVPRVTKVTAIFWNSGTDTIEGSQIATADPLRIELSDDSDLLNFEIIKQSRLVNNVSLSILNNKNAIYFDFLDQNDGFVLEILHSGGKNNLHFTGTIKGIPKGISQIESGDYFEKTFTKMFLEIAFSRANYLIPWVFLFVGIFFMTAGIYSLYYPNKPGDFISDNVAPKFIFTFIGAPYILFFAVYFLV
jgi:hypothetical protein